MKAGDIVIVNYPFNNFENAKIRPALVVSNEHFNKSKNLILVAISSQKGLSQYSHPIKQKDLKLGKLKKQSYVRFTAQISFEKKLILRKAASLKPQQFKAIQKQLFSFLF